MQKKKGTKSLIISLRKTKKKKRDNSSSKIRNKLKRKIKPK